MVSGEHRYDELGRRIASRSLRKGAWTLFRYDGLDRVVSSTTPEGDQRMTVYDKGLEIIQIQRQKDGRTGKFETTKTYTYFDEQRNPYLSVPVGTDGKPAFERSSAQVFDTRGEIVQSATPGLMKETMIRNSMGWVICEHSEPLSKKHGEKPRRTETKYDPNGRAIARIIRNTPLAFFAPTSTPTADFIPRLAAENIEVPQILQHEYDEYGRLRKTIHPDGLVKTNEYTRPGSMIEKVISTHPDDPAFKHAVGLRYDNLRRVTEIYDATRSDRDNRVQLFQYDPFGSLIRSEDRSSKRGNVIVHRRYDNLSNMLSERVETSDGRPVGAFVFDNDFENGMEIFRILGGKHVTEQWTKTIRHTDKDGRLTAIDVDDDRFCTYSYLGAVPVAKTLPKSGINLNVEMNPLLEPVKYLYRNTARGMDLCSLNYLLDPYGRVSASSCRLDYGRWDMTQCFEHDATSTLVAEHRQNSFHEHLDVKRKDVLESNNTLESWQTRWYDYDESGNLTASYRKLKPSGKEKIPAAKRDKSQRNGRENFVRGNSEYYCLNSGI